MSSPQGERQPGHSSQKGGWYPMSHMHVLHRHWPRPLHTEPRTFRHPWVDFSHWQAEPSKPSLQKHLPQEHSPRPG